MNTPKPTEAERFSLTAKGRQALMQLDRDAAETLFRSALEGEPGFVDGLVGLGQVAFERGELVQAAANFSQALKHAKEQAGADWPARLRFSDDRERAFLRAIHGHALVLYRLGKFPEASNALALEQRLDPADHQGARYIIRNIKNGKRWQDSA